MVNLDEGFIAFFVTTCNVALCAIFTFVGYRMGYNNAELDYHICTGKSPHDNIVQNDIWTNWLQQFNKTNFTFQDVADCDPLFAVTKVVALMLILISLHIWIYSFKPDIVVGCWHLAVSSRMKNTPVQNFAPQQSGTKAAIKLIFSTNS